jgi:putative transposase
MATSITLSDRERYTLLDYYRRHPDPAVRLRAHIILLLAHGYAWALIAALLFTSTQTIARWQQRFADGRAAGLLGRARGRPGGEAARWAGRAVAWVIRLTPRAFGLYRSRWSCATVALLLWQEHRVRASRETVRRWLRGHELVWRRPRPVLGPQDPRREEILAELRRQMAGTPDDETWVFTDEVDVNLNPPIGPMWMRRGQQAEVVTPGDNEKRYLAGSQHWRTGTVLVTAGDPGQGRNADLFVRHLEDLRHRLRRYRVIHVLCDNARAHNCSKVARYLGEHEGRLVVHYLPKRAPECNPIERVWWHLHDEITRDHRCGTLPELLELVLGWLGQRNPFTVEGSVYPKPNTTRSLPVMLGAI